MPLKSISQAPRANRLLILENPGEMEGPWRGILDFQQNRHHLSKKAGWIFYV